MRSGVRIEQVCFRLHGAGVFGILAVSRLPPLQNSCTVGVMLLGAYMRRNPKDAKTGSADQCTSLWDVRWQCHEAVDSAFSGWT